MTSLTEKRLWWSAVAVCLGLTLWPIWAARFPPMQDYPDQLLYSEVLRAHGDPASSYDHLYAFRFHPVYATFYVTTVAFAKLVPIEIAGKLSLSLYPLLIALVVIRLGRRAGAGSAPWGALLFFPFAFNQQYFYGNISYILSLPLMMLALLEFEDFLSDGMRIGSVLRQVGWQLALVITHPLSFVVFLGLACVSALSSWRRTSEPWKKLAATFGTALGLLAAVWFSERGTKLSDVPGFVGVAWSPPSQTASYFGLMFTGMQPVRQAQPLTLIAWAGVIILLFAAVAGARRNGTLRTLSTRYLAWLGLSVLAMFAIPFRIGDYSYLNLRLAGWVYFLVALCAAQVPFKKWMAVGLVALLGLALIDSVAMQARISAETDEILPVIQRIPPHARVLPLIFDPGSAELDKYWFAPHVRDYDYYPIVAGGGFTPYLFGSPVDPVRPKPGEERPAPSVGRPDTFTWEQHGADYQYFLVQGAPEGLAEYLSLRCSEVTASKKWKLFQRRPR